LVPGGLQGDPAALEEVARSCGGVVDIAAHNFVTLGRSGK